MTAATLGWFARHELRLAWRDLLGIALGRSRGRRVASAIGLLAFAAFLHGLAYALLHEAIRDGLAPDRRMLVILTGSALLTWCLLASQAIESVTRAFYARGDLDLILSSPTDAPSLFAVRIAGIAASASAMAMLLVAPAANVLVFLDGPRWFAIYGVAAAMGASATAVAVLVTASLFRLIGAARTRAVAQIVAAVVGAAFAIAIQGAAILSYGEPGRIAALSSEAVLSRAPEADSLLYGPAWAMTGEPRALFLVILAAFCVLGLAVARVAPRFAQTALAASGAAAARRTASAASRAFTRRDPARVLREKEWTLLRRDPWLLSQTLMQILYLVPAALLLWRYFGDGTTALPLLVPVLVMAAGQLAGGLAWLAVSGEDAPDLVLTAPIRPGQIIRAKIEAVLGTVALILAPVIVALAFASIQIATVAALGIAVAAVSATWIQLWFRAQARRSQFRRRQTSSRIATFAEAFSSVLWACAAALAAQGAWQLALVTAAICLAMLAGTRAISPRRAAA